MQGTKPEEQITSTRRTKKYNKDYKDRDHGTKYDCKRIKLYPEGTNQT
jgi:hypothetical protein